MKTAEEYWNSITIVGGFARWPKLACGFAHAFSRLVDEIRADALAEKPATPDADEERAKREYERLQSLIPDAFLRQDYESRNPASKAGWKAYVKTLPPRPMRSPGEQLRDLLVKNIPHDEVRGLFLDVYADETPELRAGMDAAANALGIEPQE